MKSETHRHFSACISHGTIARMAGITKDEAGKAISFQPDEPYSYEGFLRKFDIFNKIVWDYDKIRLSIQDVVWGLRQENIDYAEIKFSVGKYLKYINDTPEQLITFMARVFDIECSKWGVEVDLVLSLQYESDHSFQNRISDTINDDLIAEVITGIDLVGNEKCFDVSFYKPIMKRWRDAGKLCLAHVGEINEPSYIDNVRNAITELHVHRIGHGIAASKCPDVATLANDNGVAFDVCISSNVYTGNADFNSHPIIDMVNNGFALNISTDDPVVFNTNLDTEYKLLRELLGSDEKVEEIRNNSVLHSAKNILNK